MQLPLPRYRRRYGYYPQKVLADPIYGTHANRRYLKSKGILFAGKPLGRPNKVTAANRQELQRLKAQRRENYRQRIPIEGKFGQGTNGYRLNYIRAKRADTSAAWINSIFLVMDLLILLRIFFVLCKRRLQRRYYRHYDFKRCCSAIGKGGGSTIVYYLKCLLSDFLSRLYLGEHSLPADRPGLHL